MTAKLALAADQFADDLITAEQFRRLTGRLRPRLAAAEAARGAALPADVPDGVAGPDAAARWLTLPLAGKRALIDLLMVVTLLPAGRGTRTDKELDPDTVVIQWRT